MDRSIIATDLVDALHCVFSSPVLRERGPSGNGTAYVVGLGSDKLACFAPALNFFYGSQIK